MVRIPVRWWIMVVHRRDLGFGNGKEKIGEIWILGK